MMNVIRAIIRNHDRHGKVDEEQADHTKNNEKVSKEKMKFIK